MPRYTVELDSGEEISGEEYSGEEVSGEEYSDKERGADNALATVATRRPTHNQTPVAPITLQLAVDESVTDEASPASRAAATPAGSAQAAITPASRMWACVTISSPQGKKLATDWRAVTAGFSPWVRGNEHPCCRPAGR
jgi:hypothetical protein